MSEAPQEKEQTIRVKMKVGNIEFEIEGTIDQCNEAVGKFLSTVTDKLKETQLIAEREAPPARAETCKSIIQTLWREGWFREPRGLSDVHDEMGRRGYHYDRTAVAHTLVDLVKDNVLNRRGKARRYQYVQKQPPT